MSERTHHRRPATFRLGDPGVVVIDADEAGRPSRGAGPITPGADPPPLPVVVRAAPLGLAARGVVVIEADEAGRPSRGAFHIPRKADPALLPVVVEAPLVPRR